VIDKSFLEKIEAMAEPKFYNLEGLQYTSKPIHLVEALTASPLAVSTLTGIRDYLTANPDGLEAEKLLIHISTPLSVSVVSALEDKHRTREVYITATCDRFTPPPYISVEDFIVRLQTQFVPNDDLALILSIVGNLKDGAVTSHADNGITQQVTAKVGLSLAANVVVPNPVTLKPYRTFIEIEQPESLFVFRMKSGGNGEKPLCALFASDGGQWENEAMKRVQSWLGDRIDDVPIIA